MPRPRSVSVRRAGSAGAGAAAVALVFHNSARELREHPSRDRRAPFSNIPNIVMKMEDPFYGRA
jgi:hypothetical protein